MQDIPHVGPMSRLLAARTKKMCVCAGCWSELIIQPDKENPQLDHVLCPNCNCPGYVGKRFVEQEKSKSAERAIEARDNLREAVPFLNQHAGKQVSELLAELGF